MEPRHRKTPPAPQSAATTVMNTSTSSPVRGEAVIPPHPEPPPTAEEALPAAEAVQPVEEVRVVGVAAVPGQVGVQARAEAPVKEAAVQAKKDPVPLKSPVPLKEDQARKGEEAPVPLAEDRVPAMRAHLKKAPAQKRARAARRVPARKRVRAAKKAPAQKRARAKILRLLPVTPTTSSATKLILKDTAVSSLMRPKERNATSWAAPIPARAPEPILQKKITCVATGTSRRHSKECRAICRAPRTAA